VIFLDLFEYGCILLKTPIQAYGFQYCRIVQSDDQIFVKEVCDKRRIGAGIKEKIPE